MWKRDGGKTTLLEETYVLPTRASPHATQAQQLVSGDAMQSGEPVVVGRLVADVARPDGARHLEMRLIIEERGAWALGNQGALNGQGAFRREALINRRKVRLMDLLGQLRLSLIHISEPTRPY